MPASKTRQLWSLSSHYASGGLLVIGCALPFGLDDPAPSKTRGSKRPHLTSKFVWKTIKIGKHIVIQYNEKWRLMKVTVNSYLSGGVMHGFMAQEDFVLYSTMNRRPCERLPKQTTNRKEVSLISWVREITYQWEKTMKWSPEERLKTRRFGQAWMRKDHFNISYGAGSPCVVYMYI